MKRLSTPCPLATHRPFLRPDARWPFTSGLHSWQTNCQLACPTGETRSGKLGSPKSRTVLSFFLALLEPGHHHRAPLDHHGPAGRGEVQRRVAAEAKSLLLFERRRGQLAVREQARLRPPGAIGS